MEKSDRIPEDQKTIDHETRNRITEKNTTRKPEDQKTK